MIELITNALMIMLVFVCFVGCVLLTAVALKTIKDVWK